MQSVQLTPSVRGLRLSIVAAVALLATLLVPVSAGAVAGTPQNPAAESLGMNTVQVSWDAVADAAGYLVEYSTKSTFTASTTKIYERTDKPTEPAAYVDGLTINTKYYFRVYAKDADGNPGEKSVTVDATPKYEYGAVDGIKSSNIGGTFAEVEWVFNTATLGTPGWRIRAENVADRDGDAHYDDVGSDPVGKVTGLKKNTYYYIWVASLLPANGDAPAVRVGPYSKSIKIKTSNYPVDSPTALQMKVQESDSITLAWTPPANLRDGDRYVVQYAKSSSMSSATTVAATNATEKNVTGLSANVNYYMRVHVVDAAGTRVSDSSDVLQTKTPTARGTISGHVSGLPSSALDDLVVSAYATKDGMSDKGNLVEQADVNSAGNYTLAVRKGNYRVHVSYTGSGNYTSLWAGCVSPAPISPGCTNNGSPIYAYAQDVAVSTNAVAAAPSVTLGTGGKVSGTVYDPFTVAGTDHGKPLKSVDVTARSCWSEGDALRDVMAMTTTDSNGNYELSGLSDGWYWLRYVYNSGDGFEAYATAVKLVNKTAVAYWPSGGSCLNDTQTPSDIAEVNVTLAPKDFRKTYSIHVYGSRKVGTTLTTKFNKWIGDQYGTSATYSYMEWVWTRDGKDISGTSGNSIDNGSGSNDYCSTIRCTPKYKLVSADRGHKVSLKVTYSRYGYHTSTKTYPAFSVR